MYGDLAIAARCYACGWEAVDVPSFLFLSAHDVVCLSSPLVNLSTRWLKQHEKLEKLNLQAHQSARSHTDEFVLEAFVTFDRLPCLIRDLILVDCWREHVLPLLIDDLAAKKATMRAYFVLFHEATVINLLEVRPRSTPPDLLLLPLSSSHLSRVHTTHPAHPNAHRS